MQNRMTVVRYEGWEGEWDKSSNMFTLFDTAENIRYEIKIKKLIGEDRMAPFLVEKIKEAIVDRSNFSKVA